MRTRLRSSACAGGGGGGVGGDVGDVVVGVVGVVGCSVDCIISISPTQEGSSLTLIITSI